MGTGLGGRIAHCLGAGLNGGDALLIHDVTGRPNVGILQPKVKVRAGETFEVSLWAQPLHMRPVMPDHVFTWQMSYEFGPTEARFRQSVRTIVFSISAYVRRGR